GQLTISRAAASLTYPARCTLVAAMNPCPCGDATDTTHACSCAAHQIQPGARPPQRAFGAPRLQRISGPLLNRIDIHIEVPLPPARAVAAERHPAVGPLGAGLRPDPEAVAHDRGPGGLGGHRGA